MANQQTFYIELIYNWGGNDLFMSTTLKKQILITATSQWWRVGF